MIWLLRHGETEWNRDGRLQGRFDSPLTQRGVQQAQAMSDLLLRDLGMSPEIRLVASPRAGAIATAMIVARTLNLDLETDQRLVEITMGAWDGMTRDEIAAAHPEIDRSQADWHLGAPDCEKLSEVRARIASFLGEIDGPTIVVAHGLSGKILRGVYLGLDDAAALRLYERQDAVFLLDQGTEQELR
ncbi:histidine phosphatase family protein [Roseiterribacter gracilis]|uniref:Phosphoglycerate mutase n=1 Tax=Roseiterribacter gracilis TaxID=2812848 RepID=A0A8S8XBZ2_9PROT|nr:phosphoglycerate mutase [Rhodospirillales bacterium TMPK1]